MSLPRGVRNHNPGNLRRSQDRWQGLAPAQTDPEFFIFKSAPYGIRALARVLITYQDKHGRDTIRKIIARWAPPTENDTKAYIEHVSALMGLPPDVPLDVHDYSVARGLVEAIIRHENGQQPYDVATIDKGLVLAGVEPPEKPLSRSRTVRGAQLASAGVGLSAAADILNDVGEGVQALIPYLQVAQWIFVAVALAGIGLTIYARLDDKRRGLR